GANLLLLDEISEGLAPVIVQALARMITTLKAKGYTIVIVEQNFRFAAPLADRFYVVEHGQIVEQFGAEELEAKQDILNTLLGVGTPPGVNTAVHNEEPQYGRRSRLHEGDTPMKLRTLPAILAMAGFGAVAPASAAGISDDVIRIGFITDMSGVYSDIDGPAGGDAIRRAIEDMGGESNGKRIELLGADHQNKADIASARAREWFDSEKID